MTHAPCSKCGEKHFAKGLCQKHYLSAYKAERRDHYRQLHRSWSEKNKDKIIAYHAKSYLKHKQGHQARNARWYANNKEKRNAAAKAWSDANREKHRGLIKTWYSKNQAFIAAKSSKHRAVQFCATPKWANQFFIGEAFALAKLRTQSFGFKWNVDHIVPLNSKLVCGLHCEVNLMVIPANRNISKGNRHWPDMP